MHKRIIEAEEWWEDKTQEKGSGSKTSVWSLTFQLWVYHFHFPATSFHIWFVPVSESECSFQSWLMLDLDAVEKVLDPAFGE